MGRSLKRSKDRLNAGFSLIEVALSLGIIGFAMTALIGLLPFGLLTFKQAMTNTVESEIVQNLTNDILLSNFSNLHQYNGQSYSYDKEGVSLSDSTGAIYTATVSMKGVDGSNSPTGLINNGVSTSATAANTSAYNVTITISPTNAKTPSLAHSYSVIVANNNQ